MTNKNFLSLDMEYNQPSKAIIQIGITIGNLATGDILERKKWHIKSDEILAPYIIKLTAITQEDVDNGKSLIEIYTELEALHKQYDCFRNVITWGGGDSEDLRNGLKLDDETFLFGRRWIDAKTEFIGYCFANDMHHQSGLAKSLTRLGLKFEGRKHDAGDDSYNTFKIYRELLKLKEKK